MEVNKPQRINQRSFLNICKYVIHTNIFSLSKRLNICNDCNDIQIFKHNVFIYMYRCIHI